MQESLAGVAGLMLLALSSAAFAHHGFAAHYDPDRVIRIEGTVKRFDFINPHGLLFIDSVNEAGEPVVYKCDLQAAVQLVDEIRPPSICLRYGHHIVGRIPAIPGAEPIRGRHLSFILASQFAGSLANAITLEACLARQ